MRWRLISDRDPGVPDGDDCGVDAAFWASPVGEAARARLRGDHFFQIELDDATLTAYAESAAVNAVGRRVRRTCDLLGQIEELGWHLEHVSWWHAGSDLHTSAEPRARHAESGERAFGVSSNLLRHSTFRSSPRMRGPRLVYSSGRSRVRIPGSLAPHQGQ